ncbi:MAG: alkaline phosphatase family protein [Alphaproteobacteria bacterium]
MMKLGFAFAAFAAVLGIAGTAHCGEAQTAIPRYAHIYVIIEENHTFDQVIGAKYAPNFNKLGRQYGLATNFFAERHPSEPNYIAILGGDTFGIHDDDAYYCKPAAQWNEGCDGATEAGYVDHTIIGRSLVDQLTEKGLSWKGYFEDIPSAGAKEPFWPTSKTPHPTAPNWLYAVKHNGFMFYKSVQDDSKRAEKIVSFDLLYKDAAAGKLPNYAHIVPNQCNDMHGLAGDKVPEDCEKENDPQMIARADRELGKIVAALMAGPQWKAADNSAIVITFDENDAPRPDNHGPGCCGSVVGDLSNPGGGWIPTIVITNHGPRGLQDPTPYNHYSLLRTTEDAFGIGEHLRHAADEAKGVVAMAPLFAVAK